MWGGGIIEKERRNEWLKEGNGSHNIQTPALSSSELVILTDLYQKAIPTSAEGHDFAQN